MRKHFRPAVTVPLGTALVGCVLLLCGCGLLPHTPTLPGLEGTDGLVPISVHPDVTRLDPAALRVPAAFLRVRLPGSASHANVIISSLANITADVLVNGTNVASVTVPAGTASVSVNVPPGTARVFNVSYKDSAGRFLAFGAVTADISGSENLSVPIHSGVPGVLVGNFGVSIGPVGQPGSFGPVTFSFDNKTGGTMTGPAGGTSPPQCSLRILDNSHNDITANTDFSTGGDIVGTVSNAAIPDGGTDTSQGLSVGVLAGPSITGNYQLVPVVAGIDGHGRAFIKQFPDDPQDSPPTFLQI